MPAGDGAVVNPADSGGQSGAQDGSMVMPGQDASQGEPSDDAGSMPPPTGLVPVFVAVGYQSHRIISCDQGLTWPHEDMSPTGGGDDGTLMRGLAYGKNKFVASVGGGGSQELWTTEDGVAWTVQRPHGPGANGYSDVTFGNGRFVAGGGHISTISFDGVKWEMDGTMGEGGILRNLAFTNYMGGRFAASGDQGRRMNSKDGVTWGSQIQEGDSLDSLAGGNGIFVAVSSAGSTRYSTNGGDSWEDGNVGTSGVRGILHDGQKFIVTSNGGSYFSTDGVSWQPKGGGAGPYDFAVNDDRTHYAGMDGNILLHSTDGIKWTKVHEGGPAYERIKFGWVKPSTVCPLP